MNNIYLVPHDDGTYEANISSEAPSQSAALLVPEGEYPVKCYYYRQDMNGDFILEMAACANQEELICELNYHGEAFHTIRALWDFDSHDGLTSEISTIYQAARHKLHEIISSKIEGMCRPSLVDQILEVQTKAGLSTCRDAGVGRTGPLGPDGR